jgi:hypothetical protein
MVDHMTPTQRKTRAGSPVRLRLSLDGHPYRTAEEPLPALVAATGWYVHVPGEIGIQERSWLVYGPFRWHWLARLQRWAQNEHQWPFGPFISRFGDERAHAPNVPREW